MLWLASPWRVVEGTRAVLRFLPRQHKQVARASAVPGRGQSADMVQARVPGVGPLSGVHRWPSSVELGVS